jgi:hypothetical protein
VCLVLNRPVRRHLGETWQLLSVVDTRDDGKRIQVSGTVAATGNYATNGDRLDLSQVPIIASAQPPIQGSAWMDGFAGYDYRHWTVTVTVAVVRPNSLAALRV